MGEEGTEIGHSGGQDQLLQTSREETGLSLQQQFLAVATLGFINIILLLFIKFIIIVFCLILRMSIILIIILMVKIHSEIFINCCDYYQNCKAC